MCDKVFLRTNLDCPVFFVPGSYQQSLKQRRKDGHMKKLAVVILILLMTGISTGAVFAYLTSQDSVSNRITAANTDIRITEKFDPPGKLNPGTVIPKTVAVTSNSSTDCYVRVMVHFSSLEAEKFCEPLKIQSGWTLAGDGYYYWNGKVKPQETTGNLFSQITIRKDAEKEDLENFDVLIYAEAVACGKDKMEDAWKRMKV